MSDEVIDKVMAEHGKTVNETKSKLTETENELNAKVKDLTTANQTIEDLQNQTKIMPIYKSRLRIIKQS